MRLAWRDYCQQVAHQPTRDLSGVVTDNDPTNAIPDGTIIYNHPNEQAQERVPGAETVRTRRMATNVLGLGFVEAISNTTLQNIPNGQPSGMRGQLTTVPVAEAPGNFASAASDGRIRTPAC